MHAWRWDRVQNSFEFANLENPQIHLPSVFPDMQTMLARVHPKDQSAVKRAIDSAFAGQVEVRQEFELLGNDGRYRSYATTARPLLDGAAPRGLVGVIQDVTARRDSERRLRRSEALLRATTSNTADTLFLLDTAMRVRFVNNSVNGLTPEQIIGREINTLLPATASAGVLQKLGHILESGETTTFEFESIADGQGQYFENRAVLVRDDGIATGISISMRDITERKRLEQEILDVSGRERQSIGRDLHDGLGQELTGIALMLRGLSSRIQQRCPDVVENVNEIIGHLNQSIETARSLARGLLPVRTETGGLSAALRALAARSRDLYGLEVTYRSEMCPEFAFTETDASHLYRITQEALTNASRHGHASLVDISLIAKEDGFTLCITDNGVGFVRTAPSGSGMGLKIMKYRADMIGAKFEIAANQPRGTAVTVTG
jgi:two-component system, LuxR family, sensor kinase FixL